MEKMLQEVCVIFVFHYVFDFILQTRYQAENKSKQLSVLLSHTGVYSFMWFIFLMPLVLDFESVFWFTLVTFVSHTITDFFTSQISSHFYKTKQIKLFWVTIGFDQLLHQLQLIAAYWYFLK